MLSSDMWRAGSLRGRGLVRWIPSRVMHIFCWHFNLGFILKIFLRDGSSLDPGKFRCSESWLPQLSHPFQARGVRTCRNGPGPPRARSYPGRRGPRIAGQQRHPRRPGGAIRSRAVASSGRAHRLGCRRERGPPAPRVAGFRAHEAGAPCQIARRRSPAVQGTRLTRSPAQPKVAHRARVRGGLMSGPGAGDCRRDEPRSPRGSSHDNLLPMARPALRKRLHRPSLAQWSTQARLRSRGRGPPQVQVSRIP